MDEAWILSEKTAQAADAVGARSISAEQKYDSGSLQAKWSGRVDAHGRYLLDGPENWLYANGAKEYQVTWDHGKKAGAETYWDDKGRIRWKWEHRPDGLSTWIQYWPSGNLKHVSHWRNRVCEGEALSYDPDGKLTGRHYFENGELK